MPQPKSAAARTADDAPAPTLAAAPEPKWEPKGAQAKLAYIQAHMGRVAKTGENKHQGFSYFQEHGIIALLQPLIEELHVAVICTWKDVVHPVGDATMTQGTIVIQLIDTDQPPHIVFSGEDNVEEHIVNPLWQHQAAYPMHATDKVGWGAAKMLTYGEKFAMQKFFKIPTDDLPEAEREGIEQKANERRGAPAKISRERALALKKAIADGGLDENRVIGQLTLLGVDRLTKLDEQSVQPFAEWVLQEAARVKDLEPSEAAPA